MIEVYLIITGGIFFAWLYALVRQTQQGFSRAQAAKARPVVPVNLADSDEAILMAEGRGRIVYANDAARRWFGLNGGAPNLTLIAQMIQPPDSLYDLLADAGYASFRLGQRQIEAVSHVIPSEAGERTVVVMRELTGAFLPTFTEYDPLRALAVLDDMTQAIHANMDLGQAVDAVLRCIEPSVSFDCGELNLWNPETRTLSPVGRRMLRMPTGSLAPGPDAEQSYTVGDGYAGWIAMYRQPLLINDVSGRHDITPREHQAGFQSFVGVPLTIGDRFIGTLELMHRERSAFDRQDSALLQAVSGQIAAMLEAARLYSEQRARVDELGGLQQIAEAMSHLGDDRAMYGHLTQRIAALMKVELCGVLHFDEDERTFRAQSPFYGVPDQLIQRYRLSVTPDDELHTIWHYRPWWFDNSVDPALVHAMGFDDVAQAVTINTMALVPMISGTRRVGLLLVANKSRGQGFTEDDMRTLMSFASQAAIVVENARLYTEEQRRNRELSGLQQIAQALSVLRNPNELYAQITERIANLMQVEMCGVLLYDPAEQCLVAQRPFFGMEDEETMNFYQIPSPPNSAVSRLWQERESWYTNAIRRDPEVANTDLAALASAVGIRQTIFAPLTVSGARLGVIQVANRHDGRDFTESDARILSIFAGQAAILIDNARLYREMQRRTHEAEGLRAITEFASQIGPQTENAETIEMVLVAVSNLLEANFVSVGLVDDRAGELVIDPGYVWGATLPGPYRINTFEVGFEQSVLVTRRPLLTSDMRTDGRVLPQYHKLVSQFGLRQAIIVPLIIQDRSIGELMVANSASDTDFTDRDVDLLAAMAVQIAAMIDRMRLYATTDLDLRTRVQELESLTRVGHELSQTLDLDRILEVIRQEALRSTDATAATVILLADRSDWEDPEQPEIDRRIGENRNLRALAPVERVSVLRNDVIRVDDYTDSGYDPMPRQARSALVVPISFGDEAIGLIHLYSPAPAAFGQRAVDFALSLTDQATTAIANARRYQEQIRANEQLRVRADRMGRIFRMGELFRQGASLPELLEEVAHSVQETVGFNTVLLSLVDERAGVLRRTAQAGLPVPVFQEMAKTTPPLEQAMGLMQDRFKISQSYFLPAQGAEELRDGLPVLQVVQQRGEGPRAWDPEDLLIVPLYGSGGRLLGIMSVDAPQSGRRPDLHTVEALEIFANQAAFNIENYRLVERIREEAEATRRERDRLAQLHMVASQIQSAADVPARLQVVADGIHQAGWGHVIITLRDEKLEPTALISAGYTPEEARMLADNATPGETWRKWINDLEFFELRLGAGYYMRYNRPWVRANLHLTTAETLPDVPDDVWHPQDVFFLPLVGQEQKRIIGIIEMYNPADGRVPTEASLQPFELFASQAAAAIETSRLYQETVRQAEQEQRINEVMEVVSGSLSTEAVIQAMARGFQQMVPFSQMSVAIFNGEVNQFDVLRVVMSEGDVSVLPDEPIALDGTATGQVFNAREARLFLHKDHKRAHSRLSDLSGWRGQGERSTLLVPMIAGGQTLGTLRLGSDQDTPTGFQDNLELIQRLANLSAVAMDNARLFAETQQRSAEMTAQARRLAQINRVAGRLAQAITPDEIYRIALEELQDVLGAQYGGVVLVEDDGAGSLILDSHPKAQARGKVRLDLAHNQATALIRQTRRPVVSASVLTDERFTSDRDVLRARGTVSLMVVPLFMGGQLVGSVGLDFSEPHSFTAAEIELAETISNQVTVALEKANLLAEAEQRARELNSQALRLAALNRLSQRLAGTTEPMDVYRMVIEELQSALGMQSGGLMLIESPDSARLVLSTHPDDPPMPNMVVPLVGNPIAEQIFATRDIVVLNDLNDPRYESLRASQDPRGTKAMIIIPVMRGDNVIGTIGLDSATPRIFTAAEIGLARTAANQAAVAIEKAHLFNETQVRAEQLDAQAQRLALINRVTTRLSQTLDAQEIYRSVLSELAEILQVDFGGLVLFDPDNDAEADLVLSYPFTEEVPPLKLKIAGNRSIEIVRKTHRPLASVDVLNDPAFEPAWEALRARGTVSLMIVPLVVGDKVVGTIGLDSSKPREFTPEEIELAETIAGQASLAIEKARLYNETLSLTIFNQSVVESIQQGIVVMDRDLVIRRVNSFMAEWYGWSTEAVGRSLFEYRPDYAEFLREPIAIALGVGAPQMVGEVERRNASGEASIRNYYVYPMLEQRRVTGVVLLVEDVTERALLEKDLESRAIQMSALSEVSGQITSTLEPDQVIDLVLDALERVIPYDGVSLWLKTETGDELRIVAARGYTVPGSPTPEELIGLRVAVEDSPLFQDLALNAQVINVGDVGAGDPRFPYGAQSSFKNWLGAPLVSKREVVGVLALEKVEAHFYTQLHEQLALTFANQAAVALNNAQLFQETSARAQALDQQAQRLALLNRVSLALAQTLDLENIMEIALRETAIALDVHEGAALHLDIENDLAVLIVEYPRGDAPPTEVYDVGQCPVVERVRTMLIPLVIENIENNPDAALLAEMRHSPDVTTMLLVPLVTGGTVIGLLRLDSTQRSRQFGPAQIEIAQTIASQAAIAVQNAALFEQTAIRTSELETLFESAQATAVTLDLDEVVRRVTVQMLTALGTDACTVFLWDDVSDQLTVRGEIGARDESVVAPQLGDIYALDEYPLRARALRERELVIVRSDDPTLPPGEKRLLDEHGAASRMLIPLVVNEISIGLVEVETLDPARYFRTETIRLARTLASQAAISIENARLQTETRRTVEEMYIINDMSSALSSANDLDQLLLVIEAQLPSLTEAQIIYVALYDAAAGEVSFPLAMNVLTDEPLELPAQPLGRDEFSHVIRHRAPLLLAGRTLGDVRRSLGIAPLMPETACFVGVPLFVGEEMIGVLAARDDRDPLAFSHNDQRILSTVGAQLAVAIQSTRLFQQTLQQAAELDQRVRDRTAELERERQHISTLYQITTELTTSLDMDRLLLRALTMVADAVGATQGAILQIDPISEQLFFRAKVGWPDRAAQRDGGSGSGSNGTPPTGIASTDEPLEVVTLDQGLAGWAVQHHENVVVDDVQSDPRWLRLGPADDLPRAAMIALIEANDDILGVMALYSETVGAFTPEQLRLGSAAANQVANAMNNAELYSLIRDQAERLGDMLRLEQVEATKSASILESVADGVMVTDETGNVIVFNSTAERLLGVPASRVLNQPQTIVTGLYGPRWAAAAAKWQQAPAEIEAGQFLEEQLPLDNGRIISVRISPVIMSDQFLGTVSVFRDITQAVEVDRLKSEFVATVSHELRTPMTSIKGYADLLMLGAAGTVTEQQMRFLETIKQNADRLSLLVNDLLDISRIDQGRVELKFSIIDVHELLDRVAGHVRGRSEDERREMEVIVELPEDQPLTIWGDFDKVAQVITNLADNAFNYTHPGGQITLSASAANDMTVIAVKDTGIGIPPSVGDQLYERFYRGAELHDLVMDTPGTGLGLSIARELVQVHGGRIWYDSVVGQGTTFYVELPAHPADGLTDDTAASVEANRE